MKMVIVPRTKTGLGRAGLRRHLETIHGPLVMSQSEVSSHFAYYVHHYALEAELPSSLSALDDRDAITIIKFHDEAGAAAARSGAGLDDIIIPDEDNFRELDGSIVIMARERVIRAVDKSVAQKVFVFRRLTEAPADMVGWAEHLTAFAGGAGVGGLVSNAGTVVAGHFDFNQFDEISFADGVEAKPLLDDYLALANTFFGSLEMSALVTEPKVFV